MGDVNHNGGAVEICTYISSKHFSDESGILEEYSQNCILFRDSLDSISGAIWLIPSLEVFAISKSLICTMNVRGGTEY